MAQDINIKTLAATLKEGVKLQSQGEKKSAEKKYEEVLFHQKHFRQLLREPGDKNQKQKTLLNTIYSQVHNNIGIFREEEKLLGQALECFRTALDYAPGNVEALTNMARVLMKRQNFDKAYEASKKALSINPDFIPAVIQFCRACYNFNKTDEALAALSRVEKFLEKAPRLNVEYGRALVRAGRVEEARERLEKAVSLDDKNLYALLNLANVNYRLARYEAALKNYQDILKVDPKHVLALTGMGFLLQTLGQFSDAAKCYRMSLGIDSGHQETLGFYASLLELTCQYEQGIKIAEELLKSPRLPERALITGSLAKAGCERKLKRFEDSIATLKGLKKMVENPMARQQASYHLGRAFDQLGKHGEAFKAFQEANREFLKNAKSFQDQGREFLDLLERLLDQDFEPLFETPSAPESPGEDPGPVFVFGPVMAGSTALGALLPFVPGLSVFEDTHGIQGLRKRLMKKPEGYPQCLRDFDDEAIDHLKTLFKGVNDKSVFKGEKGIEVHVDALNLVDLPLILKLFPAAKLVFIQCHPLDSVLNTFFKDFMPTAVTVNFAELDKIAGLYASTMKLWEKYQKQLPLKSLNLKYEDLIKAPTREITRILKFIDYPDLKKAKQGFGKDGFFQAADLFESEYPRQRWKNYQAHLEGVTETLKPHIRAQGYRI